MRQIANRRLGEAGHFGFESRSGAVTIVLILGLSFLAAAGLPHLVAGAVSSHGAPADPLSAAASSLARGEGPAGGVSMACAATGTGDSCSSVAAPHSSSGATVGWGNITGIQTSAPIPRSYGRSMAYDPTDHYVILFGGYTLSGYISDTWAFANNTWTDISSQSTTHPSDRDHSTLAWDQADGYLLLFGGSGSGGQYGDTWSFLGGKWTSHSPSNHPSGRWSAAMAYDSADGYAVLFGGCNSGSEQSDTWTYLNGTWTQLFPSQHPSSRGDAGMTYDPLAGTSGAVILFGGYDSSSSWGYFNDTWLFSGGNWTLVNTTHSPAPRTSPSFAFDPWLGGIVLFGGEGVSGYYSDTWLFANGDWTFVATNQAPQPRLFGIMATDYGDHYLVLFGGEGNNFYNDTWVLYTVTANANATTTQGAAPLAVSFQASAVDAFAIGSYAWSFGDGSNGTGSAVGHTYTLVGSFLATVTVTDVNGVVALTQLLVTVTPALSLLAIVSANQGVAPLADQFIALASGGNAPYSWGWKVDGSLVATSENASYSFTAAGSYTVVATVSDASQTSRQQSFQIDVTAPIPPGLVASATASVLAGEAPLAVAFTGGAQGGTAPYTLGWTFGDGSTGTGASPTHTYQFAGQYSVLLTVTDAGHQTSSAPLSIAVGAPVAVTASVSTTGGRAPLPVSFTASGSGGVDPLYFLWTFGDGASGAGAVVAHTYTKVGSFLATVEIVDSVGHNAFANVSVAVSAAQATPPTNGTTSSGANAAVDPTTVVVGAEVGATGIAVALLVLLFRRRR